MTLQEKELLSRFLEQLKGAQAGAKDTEAEVLIKDACARQPDAAYLLVQRAIQLDQALLATQAQVQKLQAELDQARPSSGGGFLNDPNAWGSKPSVPMQQNPGAQRIPGTGAAAAPGHGPMAGTAAAAAPAQRSSWGSGMLGNVATTAAGVVGGAFLFQGIQSLMHRNDSQTASKEHAPEHQAPEHHAAASEPELLNSYDTPEDAGSDTLASGFDDASDVG